MTFLSLFTYMLVILIPDGSAVLARTPLGESPE